MRTTDPTSERENAPRRLRARSPLVAVARVAVLASIALACPAATTGDDAAAVAVDVERFRVPLSDDDYALGGETPLVTVVVFSDYACVPCGRTWRVMKNLVEDYGEDVRVVYRSYTVAGHGHGERAAEAAFAAGAQGKFWDMHWRLFEDEDQFSRPSLRAHAEALGLDVPRFLDELDTGVHSSRRMRERRQATELGIRALPVTFINGLFLMGAAPDEAAWHALIDEEIKRSRELLRDGTPRAELYAAYMKTAKRTLVVESDEARELRAKRMAEQAAADAVARTRLASPDPERRYAVPTEGAPALGPEDAPVVVVEFVDFACPYCRQTHEQVLPGLRERYGDRVRLVVRHLPLEIHPAAAGAARASVAAMRQGKFWEFHDALFAGSSGLGQQRFVAIAQELGLDVDRFLADLGAAEVAAVVDADVALSRRLGVHGTPGVFVNGRYVHGAQDLGIYTAMIDAELAAADQAIAAGTARADVHAALMKDALAPEQFPNPTPTPSGAGDEASQTAIEPNKETKP